MNLRLFLGAIGLSFFTLSCGVKGKPLPPLTAPPIGRGQPTMAQPPEEATPTPTPEPRSGGSTGR